MCKNCGCEEALERQARQRSQPGDADPHGHHDDHGHGHHDDHGHGHHDDHGHGHHHDHEDKPTRLVKLERKVLEENDSHARKNRARLRAQGIAAINLISSPGSGKTRLLEETLLRLQGKLAVGVITGDLQTDNDARRLMNKGAPVIQIETGNSCHLNAEQIGERMDEVITPRTRLLIIENVGNLVCPAAFDLGEGHKIALLSVTEGEDKPLKYPVLFLQASLILITKTDLLPLLEWNRQACHQAIRKVNPEARILELSAKTGEGLEPWLQYLKDLASAQ